MIILLKLLLAHFLGDFVLQPTSWVQDKEQKILRSKKFYLHILLHGIIIIILLADFTKISNYFLALLIMLIHGLIDMLKLYYQKDRKKAKWFLMDQAAHILSLFILWYWWESPNWKLIDLFQSNSILTLITALVFLTFVSDILMKMTLGQWAKDLGLEEEEKSLKNAGKWIGIIERLFVFVFIVTGNWSAIGFLITAKSVFRFGDLRESKNRKLTEYVLIGTLMSFGIAIVVGMMVKFLLENDFYIF